MSSFSGHSAPPVPLSSALATISVHLSRVEDALLRQASTVDTAASGMVRHACAQGGKRLRPALVLLSANALGEVESSHYDLAVALELIHAASLVHDDIMDGAELRRGHPTPSSIWGNRVAVRLGDLLLTRALALVASLADRGVCDLVTASAEGVCRGEILQSKNIGNPLLHPSEYCEIVSLKTGSLFRAASAGAARLSGSTPATVHALGEFGRLVGVAYQIYDDCADMSGAAKALGKTLGTDLESGTMTLPVIMFLEKYPETERLVALGMLRDEGGDPLGTTWRMFIESGVIGNAAAAGLRLLDEAESHLARLPQSAGLGALRGVTSHVRHLFRGVSCLR